MIPFTRQNWLTALIKIYEKAVTDPAYRGLCLSDPRAAVKQVSEIEIPDDFKFQFFDDQKTMLYTLLLPPAMPAESSGEDIADRLITWSVRCTDPTEGIA